MFDSILRTINFHLAFYSDFLQSEWRTMTPVKYATMLITIAVVGWLLMKKGVKGPGE